MIVLHRHYCVGQANGPLIEEIVAIRSIFRGFLHPYTWYLSQLVGCFLLAHLSGSVRAARS